MPVAGTWETLCPLHVLWHTLNALAGVSGLVVLKACEQGWDIHGNITSLLGILSGPAPNPLPAQFCRRSDLHHTPPNGFPMCWAPGLLACDAQGYIRLPCDRLGKPGKERHPPSFKPMCLASCRTVGQRQEKPKGFVFNSSSSPVSC